MLLAVIFPGEGWAEQLRVFIGDSAHPVVSGEAWLVANRWGAYPGVLVATIKNGKLQPRMHVQFPEYWDQASDYKLLLALADRTVGPAASMYEESAYGADEKRPEFLRGFKTVYLSPPIPGNQLGRDWPAALDGIGHRTGSNLLLPLPVRRTIRLLYPDGTPLANSRMQALLFGSDWNHCGGDAGIDMGSFTTNHKGELDIVAPAAPLALLTSYYKVENGGPAGMAFFLEEGLIVGGEPAINVKELWTLPQHDYVVRLRTAGNQPIAHARLNACMNLDICGDGCGPIPVPDSDASGAIRFRHEDLREMNGLTVIRADGKKRDLTNSEMHDLLTTYHLDLRWD